MTAFLLNRFHIDDYDEWKRMFDSDPVGRKEAARGHRIFRNVDDPKDVLIAVEFDSTPQATSFRERLLGSGVLDRLTVTLEPTIVESAEEITY